MAAADSLTKFAACEDIAFEAVEMVAWKAISFSVLTRDLWIRHLLLSTTSELEDNLVFLRSCILFVFQAIFLEVWELEQESLSLELFGHNPSVPVKGFPSQERKPSFFPMDTSPVE